MNDALPVAERPATAEIRVLPRHVEAIPTTRVRLTTVRHCGRELARVYAAMKRGALDPNTGAKLTYTLVSLSRVLEVAAFEDRLLTLEGRVRELR